MTYGATALWCTAISLVKTELVDAIGHVRQAVRSRGTRLHGETKRHT